MKDSEYHIPVLLHAATSALIKNINGNYVDVTFGGGGHSKQILKLIQKGRLISFDHDGDAFSNEIDDSRFLLVRENFRNIQNVLEVNDFGLSDGILADLGVSSYQFDKPERGFSFRFDADLDMRMNKDAQLSAFSVVNNYSDDQLINLLIRFGDFRKLEAVKIANNILEKRETGSLQTTFQLANTIDFLVPVKVRNQFLARVFQALRIEVNQEMDALVEFLNQIPRCLKPGGIAVVITYHSLEDRLVKNFFRSGNVDGVLDKDFFGVVTKPFDLINKKPIVADSKELKSNPRSRSAKLRIAKLN
jgi:16S rRNA (cytosine1402-N4)-methyltransferase